MSTAVNVFWFRRDLRLHDNVGLFNALKSTNPVVPIFIFDTNILDKLEDKQDRRVSYIFNAIETLQKELREINSGISVYYSKPLEAFRKIIKEFKVEHVFLNHDYEPYALDRDIEIESFLKEHGIGFQTFKDHVIFEKNEVVKDNGEPYTVFTPYSRKWKDRLANYPVSFYPCEKYFTNFFQLVPPPIPTMESMGFLHTDFVFPEVDVKEQIVRNYDQTRDFPGLKEGTTKMGIHLRFGTVSIRSLVATACNLNNTYLNELIWRDFYQMILCNFPKVGKGKAFRSEYENIEWLNNENDFQRWCKGTTGYPIVDAGMRELNETGFMHNRVRMITASFLTKHLLIDWRWGEAYFANKLLDFELASNNGGWQWAAGSGCDAAPYFRIFNPALQTKRFDEAHSYINKWVPELNELTYPQPIIDHKLARERTLNTYKKALGSKV